jgi:hypothetical protein
MKQKKTKITVLIISILNTLYIILNTSAAHAAPPSSTNYELQSYSFGSGGTASSSSTNYSIFGASGELAVSSQSSQNYKIGSGLSFLIRANVPSITLSNTGGTYDRLNLTIGTNDNPTDATYAVQISTDNSFTTDLNYIKPDNTLGTSLDPSDFRSYSSWGSGSGVTLTGLERNTTYYARAKARQGSFTETEWSTATTSGTIEPSLTFSIDSETLTFDNLNSSNSYTDSSKSTILTTSTNAYNGYIINARETAALTASGVGTIADFSSPNSSPTTWSGYGFGYTTSDSNLTGGTADRFTNSGPKYAGFTTSSPGDPVADHSGPITSAISNEQFTVSYRVSVNETQPAARYSTTVLYIVVPSY